MKKRIIVLACLMGALVWVSTHSQRTSAYFWPEEYASCISSHFSTGGACYSSRWGAEDACDATYPLFLYPAENAACKQAARDNWWSCESNNNGIFGNCTSQVNFNYNDLDFCQHSVSVYNDCFTEFQCVSIEDDDARVLCTAARMICETNSGIDRCR